MSASDDRKRSTWCPLSCTESSGCLCAEARDEAECRERAADEAERAGHPFHATRLRMDAARHRAVAADNVRLLLGGDGS